MKVTSGHVVRYSRPWPPALGPREGVRQGLIVHLYDAQGREGVGECAPLPPFTKETLQDVFDALERLFEADSSLFGVHFVDLEAITAWVNAKTEAPTLTHGLEQALIELLAAQTGVGMEALLGLAERPYPKMHRLVASIDDLDVREEAPSYKLKIGNCSPSDAVERVRKLRSLIGARPRIRLDANRGYSFDDAVAICRGVRDLGVEFIEEPLAQASAPELARLRRAIDIPVALDESVREIEELEAHIEAKSGDVIVLKPMFIGGYSRTTLMAQRGAAAGLRVVVTTSLDGDVARDLALLCARACAQEALLDCGLHPTSSTLIAKQEISPGHHVPHPLAVAATARPHHAAMVVNGTTVSFLDLKNAVVNRAAAWAESGVTRRQRVPMAFDSTLSDVVDFWALTWLGAVPVLTNPSWSSERRLAALQTTCTAPSPQGVTPISPDWALDAIRVIVFTSGSTGHPRPVPLTTQQLLSSALGQAARIGHHLDDRWLCALPLHHVGGLSVLLRTAWLTTTCVLEAGWDARQASTDCDSGHVTMISLVPKMLDDLLEIRGDRSFPASLRVLLLGGAAAGPLLLTRARELKAPVALTWGMTEGASQVATNIPGDLRSSLAPLCVTLVQSEGGQLVISGPIVRDAPLATGDRGSMGEDGRVFVLGRGDDVIISGGENISLKAIEAALNSHPGVSESIAVGVSDPTWGERPWAVVVPQPGVTLPDLSDLRRHVTSQLGSIETPDRIAVVPRVPRNAMGKVSMDDIASLFPPETEGPNQILERIVCT